MEKGRKLSLKRKTLASGHEPPDKRTCQTISTTDQTSRTKKLADNSTNDDSVIENGKVQNHKAFDRSGCNGQLSCQEKSCDNKLLELRKMLGQLSATNVDVANLAPFPAHIQNEQSDDKNSCTTGQGQSTTTSEEPATELSPFPKPCRQCNIREPKFSDNSNNDQSKLTNSDNSSNANDHSAQIPKTMQSDHNKKVTVLDSVPSTSQSSYNKNKQSCNIKKTESAQVTAKLNNVSVDAHRIVGRLPGSNSEPRRDDNAFITENSHLIRDRNSNLYSLQTKNADQLRSMRNNNICGSGGVNVGASKTCVSSTGQEMVNGQQFETNVVSENCQASNINSSIKGVESTEITGCASNTSASTNSHSNKPSKGKQTVGYHGASRKVVKTQDVKPTASSSHLNKVLAKDSRVTSVPSTSGQSAPNGKPPVILAKCPLCQMEFDPQFTQVEKDGHIAQCLSTAGDVMW